MKWQQSGLIALYCVVAILQSAWAATINPSLAKAKNDAESKGYIFIASHDEIVAQARKEAKLRVLSGLTTESLKAMVSAFRQKYPFVEISAHEATGSDEHQRILLELKAGLNKEWDVISMANDLYNEYQPYQKKLDILGMSENSVLQIHPKMIDPKNRNVASVTSIVQIGVTYNNKLVRPDKAPGTWEDYLKPEFKGKKIMADIRPTEIAALVPAWGLEKTLDYARNLAAQDLVWVRGGSRAMAALLAGEYPLGIGNNYRSVRRSQLKDRTGTLAYKILEPVPVRPSESLGIIATSARPHASLLWLEFQASAEGQKIMDQFEPFAASIYGPGSIQGEEIRGKMLSLVDWDHYAKLSDYQDKVVAAYGFPKAELK